MNLSFSFSFFFFALPSHPTPNPLLSSVQWSGNRVCYSPQIPREEEAGWWVMRIFRSKWAVKNNDFFAPGDRKVEIAVEEWPGEVKLTGSRCFHNGSCWLKRVLGSGWVKVPEAMKQCHIYWRSHWLGVLVWDLYSTPLSVRLSVEGDRGGAVNTRRLDGMERQKKSERNNITIITLCQETSDSTCVKALGSASEHW